MDVTVSVIIPTYNHEEFLSQAIESALAQTLAPSEVIVVDDGSTDGTRDVLSRYANDISIVSQKNRGVAAARNNGAATATGELLTFLDADDIWSPQKLERQVKRFLNEPELGLVHCGMEEVDVAGNNLRDRLDGMEGWVGIEMLLFRNSVILGAGSTMMVPRPVFDEIGGFDTRLSTSADWDFCYRIASGHKVGFVREILVRYRMHGKNMHSNVLAMERDMRYAYEKAFADADAQLRRLRRRCYGNLHAVLAGSFFGAGQYRGFLRHAMKSLFLTPSNISRFAEFPVRRWRRSRLGPSDSTSGGAAPETVR